MSARNEGNQSAPVSGGGGVAKVLLLATCANDPTPAETRAFVKRPGGLTDAGALDAVAMCVRLRNKPANDGLGASRRQALPLEQRDNPPSAQSHELPQENDNGVA